MEWIKYNKISFFINKMNAINNILLSYASYQKSYSKGLESIYKSNKDLIKDDYLLDKNISLLINSIKLKGEFIESITNL